MSETVWRQSEDWIGAAVEDSFVMVNIEDGKHLTLNRTAHAVWRALEIARTQREICDILLKQFDVPPETCVGAVLEALETMRNLGLASPS